MHDYESVPESPLRLVCEHWSSPVPAAVLQKCSVEQVRSPMRVPLLVLVQSLSAVAGIQLQELASHSERLHYWQVAEDDAADAEKDAIRRLDRSLGL